MGCERERIDKKNGKTKKERRAVGRKGGHERLRNKERHEKGCKVGQNEERQKGVTPKGGKGIRGERYALKEDKIK